MGRVGGSLGEINAVADDFAVFRPCRRAALGGR
jgi:hypothetical protein